MIQKLKMLIFSLSALFLFAAPLALPASVMAADCTPNGTGGSDCIQGGLCKGANTLNVAAGQEGCSESGNGLQGTVKTVVNVFSVVVGIVAVIMIIVGGFRYITSGGSSEKVTAAKNTLLYAIIGLVIVALSQVIVRFVLTKTVNGT